MDRDIYPKQSGLGFFDSVFEAMSVLKRLADMLLTLPYFRPARSLKMSTGHFLDAPPCLDLTPNKFVLILPNHSASSTNIITVPADRFEDVLNYKGAVYTTLGSGNGIPNPRFFDSVFAPD